MLKANRLGRTSFMAKGDKRANQPRDEGHIGRTNYMLKSKDIPPIS